MKTSSLGALVTGVDHVGIAVADLDEAITWYADTLGLVATHTETNEEQGVREAMLSAPVTRAPPSSSWPRCGGLADREVPRPQRSGHPAAGLPGRRHRRRVRRAAGQGGAAALRRARRGTADSRINFVHPSDAGGVLVELVEPAVAGALTAHLTRRSSTTPSSPGMWALRT
jgi:methylmalonyl-CoA/ethylmalonyl-CoA epimerase